MRLVFPGSEPSPFELHRADVAQCRVKPAMVVEGQPVDDFVHGITPCLEALSVQPSDLQRSPQALGARVVPAVALSAHRAAPALTLQRVLELVAAVLAA